MGDTHTFHFCNYVLRYFFPNILVTQQFYFIKLKVAYQWQIIYRLCCQQLALLFFGRTAKSLLGTFYNSLPRKCVTKIRLILLDTLKTEFPQRLFLKLLFGTRVAHDIPCALQEIILAEACIQNKTTAFSSIVKQPLPVATKLDRVMAMRGSHP